MPSASALTAGLNGLNWHGQVWPATLEMVTVPPFLCAPVPWSLPPFAGLLLLALPIALSPPPQAAASRPTASTAAATPLMDFIVSALHCSDCRSSRGGGGPAELIVGLAALTSRSCQRLLTESGAGRLDTKRERTDQRRVVRKLRNHQLRRKRYRCVKRLTKSRCDLRPRADNAATGDNPYRIDCYREVCDVHCELTNERVGQDGRIRPFLRQCEDIGRGQRLLQLGACCGGERLTADDIFQYRAVRFPHVTRCAQVVTDFAGCAVSAGDDRAAADYCNRKAGAEIEVYTGIAASQRAPAKFRGCGGLDVGREPYRNAGKCLAQPIAERNRVPAWERWRELDPVVVGDAQRGGADADQLAALTHCRQKVAARSQTAFHCCLGSGVGEAVNRRSAEACAGQFAYRNGNLGAAEVEPEHDGRWGHGLVSLSSLIVLLGK